LVAEAILLTGPPGCGKTTAIRTVLSRIPVEAGGFYTEEIREGGARTGFRLLTLDGREAVLADVRLGGVLRIGKYGVDLAALERTGVRSLQEAIDTKDLVVVDEIGPMELLSPLFREIVLEALESPVPILGTVTQKSAPFPDYIKTRPEVTIIPISRRDWSETVKTILNRLRDELDV
jgi:nucleoside-triphosphatase